MTGNSWNWDRNRKIAGFGLFGFGVVMIAEHYFTYGGMDIEMLGHEWYGLGSIIVGFLLMLKWKQLPGFIKAIQSRDIKKILDEGERGE